MDTKINKNTWIGIIVLIVIAALVVWFTQYRQGSMTESPEHQAITPPAASNSLHAGLTYQQALVKYKNRVQFNNCHGAVGLSSVGTMTVKKGSAFMLDNRDPKAHTIAFSGQSYRLGAYDFAIVSASKVGTYPITCDGGGAATLNVEL